MNILVDSHILIWLLVHPKNLSKKQIQIILEPSNNIFVSSVSLWEISLKYSLGKLYIDKITPEDIFEEIEKSGFDYVELSPEEAATIHKLPKTKHKDPFDRMLIWQSIQRNFVFMTNDKSFGEYTEYRLKII